MTSLVISGEIVIDPDDFDAALAIVEPLVAATQQEPGCIAYDFWVAITAIQVRSAELSRSKHSTSRE